VHRLLLALLLGCTHFTLVESQPVETTLDRGALPEAYAVWPQMIDRARERIDFAEMYAVDEAPSRLTPVVAAVGRALGRGVRVRWLAAASFAKTYPDLLAWLEQHGAKVKRLEKPFLHAKYFVVDGHDAYLGSQNFDWRSLEHIQELGVRFDSPKEVAALEDVFETDWMGEPHAAADAGRLRGSPQGPVPWDLPELVKLVDSARASVRVQVLTYGNDIDPLRDALVRAAARGVSVQLLTSDWELRPKTLPSIERLDPRVQVRILTIPKSSKGDIPFARVAHAKYCVVDGARGWVGTGNWERDYFEKSRNVGLFFDGGEIPQQLAAFFANNWNSAYAAPPGGRP